MSYLHDLTAAGIGRVANPLGLPIRSGILRAETGNRTGQWEGDKDQVGGADCRSARYRTRANQAFALSLRYFRRSLIWNLRRILFI